MRAGWVFFCGNADFDQFWLRWRLWAPEPLVLNAINPLRHRFDTPRRCDCPPKCMKPEQAQSACVGHASCSRIDGQASADPVLHLGAGASIPLVSILDAEFRVAVMLALASFKPIYPAIAFNSHPLRYSRVRYWLASRQLVTRKASGSHSMRWPTRSATLPS